MAAIEEFHFPDEYLKNYCVIIDRVKQIHSLNLSKKVKKLFPISLVPA